MGILCLQLSSLKDLLPLRPHSFRVPSDTREHTERRNSTPRNSAMMAKEGREDGREGRVLSERRASFACGIKIRVPRYTVVLRSQTQPSGVLSRKDERGAFKRFAEPFFFQFSPPPPSCAPERHARVYGADVPERAHLREIADLWEKHPRPSGDCVSRIDSRRK